MKKGFAYGIVVFFMSFLLMSCKLTISSFTAPDSANTGEIITLTIIGDADSSGGECGLILQIPVNWEVISAAKSDATYPLSEKTQYASLYTAPSGYKIWVGTTDTSSNMMGQSVTATVKILTGRIPTGASGTSQNYNVKIAAGSFRDGAWVTDDPANEYDFSKIAGDKYLKSISVTNVTDSLPPVAVTQLTVTDHYTGTEVSLSWNGYDETAQKDVVKYRIYQSTANFTNVSGIGYIEKSPGTFSYDISNLMSGTTYYFAVTAIDEIPNENKTVSPVSVIPQHKTGNIRGQVFCYYNCGYSPCPKQGIAEAKITAQNDLFSNIKTTALSDNDGYYTLNNLPIGKYRITIEAYGYITQHYSDVEVLENQTVQVPNEQALTLKTYNQWELDAAVFNEAKKWDAGGDGRIGLEEAIQALQVVSGLKP